MFKSADSDRTQTKTRGLGPGLGPISDSKEIEIEIENRKQDGDTILLYRKRNQQPAADKREEETDSFQRCVLGHETSPASPGRVPPGSGHKLALGQTGRDQAGR